MTRKLVLLLYVFFVTYSLSGQSTPAYKDSKQPTETRINDLLKKMTVEEKIGQLGMPALLKDDQQLRLDIKEGKIGAFCVVRYSPLTLKDRNDMQRMAVEGSRLGIPIIFAFDVIHGYKTIFPTPLALSSTWDAALVEQTAQVAAREASVSGMDITFSPMLDVSRDARWGRISESSGEDVLLNTRLGEAMVKGYQGNDLKDKYSIGSCIKHFVGYGAAIGGRDYQFTELSERALREVYLPPFQACVEAGAVSVMSAFNDISGVPASANSFTLDHILRKEWGFKGFVVSDWQSVIELKDHGIAGSDKDAAMAALTAGLDMEMTSNCYATLIKEVKEKRLSTQIVDEAVKRILRIKFELGLFDNPYTVEGEEISSHLSDENRTLARKSAAESMVLLKNNDILPLNSQSGSYTVLGEWTNSTDVLGWWTGYGDKKDVVTVIDGLKANKPAGVEFSHGAGLQAINSDTVIVCIGESGNMFGEDHSRAELELPWGQSEIVRQLKENGKTVIAVIFNGRPLVLTEVEKYADAILLAWHPGTETGNALADVLFGKTNPNGRLTVSFPKKTGQAPLFYSERSSGRPNHKRYMDVDADALYPFGYGLSYTTFAYDNMRFSKSTLSKKESTIVSIDISNTGSFAGKEVVQLYIHDKVASITQPQRKLIDFKKIELKAGEKQTVSFEISPDQLSILDGKMNRVQESGDFDVWIGKDSRDTSCYKILTVR